MSLVVLVISMAVVAPLTTAQTSESDNDCANCVADAVSANERFIFRGSWGDKSSSRALRWGPHAYGYNWETCTAACQGYRYMALQDGESPSGLGYCSCCNTWSEVNKYGSESCGENQNETCSCGPIGGKWCNFVIELNYNPSEPYVYVEKGHYLDSNVSRALRFGPQAGGYTEQLCAATCKATNAKYFALQRNSTISTSNWCSCSGNWTEVIQYDSCEVNTTNCNQVFEFGDGSTPAPTVASSSSSSSSVSTPPEDIQFNESKSSSGATFQSPGVTIGCILSFFLAIMALINP